MSTDSLDLLTLVVGSTRPFEIEIADKNNEDLDLTGVTRASFRIADSVESTTYVLELDTDEGDLAVGSGKLTGSMTQTQADALTTGEYVAEASLLIDGGWQHTDIFHVRIRPAIAEHLA